jgi:hypothetical protein
MLSLLLGVVGLFASANAQTLGYDYQGFTPTTLGCGTDSGVVNVLLSQPIPTGAGGLKAKQIAFAIYGNQPMPAYIQLDGNPSTSRLSTSGVQACCAPNCDLAVQVAAAGQTWYNSPCGTNSCGGASTKNQWYYMDFSSTPVGTIQQTNIGQIEFFDSGGGMTGANMINIANRGSAFFLSYTLFFPTPSITPSVTASPVSPSLTASTTASESIDATTTVSSTGSPSVSASVSVDVTDTKSASPSRTTSRSESLSRTNSRSESASVSGSRAASSSVTTTMSPSLSFSVSKTVSATATISSTGVCSDARTYFNGVSSTIVDVTATYHVRHWVNVTHDLTPPAEQFIGANPTCTQTSTSCTCVYTGGDSSGGCTINRYASLTYTYGSPQTTTYVTQSPLCAYFFAATIFIPSITPSVTVSSTVSRSITRSSSVSRTTAASVSATLTPTQTPYLPWFQGLTGCCHNSIDTAIVALNVLTPYPYVNMGINRISIQYWPLAAGTATFTIALMNVAGGSFPGWSILASKTFSVTSPGSFPTYSQQVATFTDLDPISSYVLGGDVEYAIAFYGATPGIIDIVVDDSTLYPFFWNSLMPEYTGTFYTVGETDPLTASWLQSTNISFVAVGAGSVLSSSPSLSMSRSYSSSLSATTSSSPSASSDVSQSTSGSVTIMPSQSISITSTASSSSSVTESLSLTSSSSLTGTVAQSLTASSSSSATTSISSTASSSESATISITSSMSVSSGPSSSSTVSQTSSLTATRQPTGSATSSLSTSATISSDASSSLSVSTTQSGTASSSGSGSIAATASRSVTLSQSISREVSTTDSASASVSTTLSKSQSVSPTQSGSTSISNTVSSSTSVSSTQSATASSSASASTGVTGSRSVTVSQSSSREATITESGSASVSATQSVTGGMSTTVSSSASVSTTQSVSASSSTSSSASVTTGATGSRSVTVSQSISRETTITESGSTSVSSSASVSSTQSGTATISSTASSSSSGSLTTSRSASTSQSASVSVTLSFTESVSRSLSMTSSISTSLSQTVSISASGSISTTATETFSHSPVSIMSFSATVTPLLFGNASLTASPSPLNTTVAAVTAAASSTDLGTILGAVALGLVGAGGAAFGLSYLRRSGALNLLNAAGIKTPPGIIDPNETEEQKKKRLAEEEAAKNTTLGKMGSMIGTVKSLTTKASALADKLPLPDSVKKAINDPTSLLPKSAKDMLETATGAAATLGFTAASEDADVMEKGAATPAVTKKPTVTFSPVTTSNTIVEDGGVQLQDDGIQKRNTIDDEAGIELTAAAASAAAVATIAAVAAPAPAPVSVSNSSNNKQQHRCMCADCMGTSARPDTTLAPIEPPVRALNSAPTPETEPIEKYNVPTAPVPVPVVAPEPKALSLEDQKKMFQDFMKQMMSSDTPVPAPLATKKNELVEEAKVQEVNEEEEIEEEEEQPVRQPVTRAARGSARGVARGAARGGLQQQQQKKQQQKEKAKIEVNAHELAEIKAMLAAKKKNFQVVG